MQHEMLSTAGMTLCIQGLLSPDDPEKRLHTLRKSPSLSFMMLALCTAVTFFLLLRKAYPKAYSTVLLDFN